MVDDTSAPTRADAPSGEPGSKPTHHNESFLQEIPKTDLHVHLDGSLRPETLIELARERKIPLPSETPDGLFETVFKERYRDLVEYLQGFAYTCAVLVDEEPVERVAYELGSDCLAEGVRYLEVRFAPHLHIRNGFGVAEVLAAVDRGLDRVRREHEASPAVHEHHEPPFRYGIIACAMRYFTRSSSPYYDRLSRIHEHWSPRELFSVASHSLARAVVEARDRLGLAVVGLDLAGAEAGHPASDHVPAFDFAHENFLKKTVHAGEAYGPESIFQAITLLHADRIGHGTHLYAVDRVSAPDPEAYVERLVDFVADRRITVEVCVTSNLQTLPELTRVEDHPFGRMVRDRLSVSLCTDNRLMSRTTVTREIQQAVEAFRLSPEELRNTIIYGFKRSFLPASYSEKRAYVRAVIDFYDRVARKHGVARHRERDGYPRL